MVLNGDKCVNALYNANHRELQVSTLMGFCLSIITNCLKESFFNFFNLREKVANSFE